VNIIKMAPKANKGKGKKGYEVLGKGKGKGRGKAVAKAVAKVKAQAKAKPKARQRPAAAPVVPPAAAPVAMKVMRAMKAMKASSQSHSKKAMKVMRAMKVMWTVPKSTVWTKTYSTSQKLPYYTWNLRSVEHNRELCQVKEIWDGKAVKAVKGR
jgi:hypothetical protein